MATLLDLEVRSLEMELWMPEMPPLTSDTPSLFAVHLGSLEDRGVAAWWVTEYPLGLAALKTCD